MRRTLPSQIKRYAATGILAAIAHYGVLAILVECGRLSPVPSSLVAFFAGGVTSYGINRRFTFASDRPHATAVPRFVATAAGGLVLTGFLMHVLVEALGIHYLPAQLATTLVVMGWTFAMNRSWTFAAIEGER